jgi:peptidase M15-like protein
VQTFVQKVIQITLVGPVQVTSWGRTRSHNAAVGGEPSSQHLVWTAMDLVPGDGDMVGLESVARTMGFGFVLNEGTHVHVQLFPAGLLPQWVYDQIAVA